MRSLVFYGDDLVAVELPDDTRVVHAPEPLPALEDYEEAVRTAIREPLGSPPLKNIVNPTSRITIAFDDPCIPQPPMRRDVRGRAIEVILGELLSAGVKRNNITLICAVGLHRKWTPRELRFILGKAVWTEMGAGRITNHDAEDPLGIVELDRALSGRTVRVNRAVSSSDLVIYVNVNWTSMNGGWKSILVGLGDYESIAYHHNVGVLAEGGTVMDHRSEFHARIKEMGGVIKENALVFTVESVLNSRAWSPLEARLFSLDRTRQPLMFRAARSMPQTFKSAFSSLMRSSYQPIAVYAGDVDLVHEKTLESLYQQQNVRVDGQTDALFLALPNMSPYAAFSSFNPLLAMNLALGYIFNMHLGRPPVREGGVMVLLQPFIPGFNRRHHPSYIEFYERVLPETRDPQEMESRFEKEFARRPEYIDSYRFRYAYHGVHPFYAWYWGALALKHLSRVIVVGAVDPAVPARMGFECATTVEKAMDMAAESLGKGFSMTHMAVPPVFAAEVV